MAAVKVSNAWEALKMRRLGCMAAVAAALLCPVAPAGAATPESGAIGPQQRLVEFRGEITSLPDGPAVLDVAQGTVGGMYGICPEPSCDTFTLDVAGAAAGRLRVAVEVLDNSGLNIAMEVTKPDGTSVYAGGDYFNIALTRVIDIPQPADGTYTITITGEGAKATGRVMKFAGGAFVTLPGGPQLSGSQAVDEIVCPVNRRHNYQGPVGSGDPLFERQWNMQQIKAPAAWERGFNGEGVTIAIVDSGVDPRHPEFAGRLAPGIDVTDDESADCGPGPQDDLGHGTHVAGIAAAGAADGHGIRGVAPKATVLPVKVCRFDNTCEFTRDLVDGVRYAIAHGADVINLSLGGWEADALAVAATGGGSTAGFDEIEAAKMVMAEAAKAGVIVVASAGNSDTPLCLWPARAAGVLCVASSDIRGLPSEYSALPNGDEVSNGVRAPGGSQAGENIDGACTENILSSVWGGAPRNCDLPGYAAYRGTSMASPHVAGLAALLVQAGLSRTEVLERIRMTASNKGASDPVMGYGLIDANAATEGLKPVKPGSKPKPKPKPKPHGNGNGNGNGNGKSASAGCRSARRSARKAMRTALRARRAAQKAHTRAAKRRLTRSTAAHRKAQRRVVRRCA